MSYDLFLAFLSQMYNSKKARLVIQGSVIFIETSKKADSLQMKTKVFSGDDLNNTSSCIPSNGVLHVQDRSAYLKLDPTTKDVYLINEVKFSNKYLPFRYQINDFVDVANEWKEILEDFSTRNDAIPTL